MGHGFSPDQLQVTSLDREIHIVGLQTRTSNDTEYAAAPGSSPIANLVAQVHEGNSFDRIPNAAPGFPMYATYSAFAPVEGGSPEYTYTMGLEVVEEGHTPDGMCAVMIPVGTYLSLPVPDATPERIPAAWSWLLEYFDEAGCPYRRVFDVDYEAYTIDPQGGPASMIVYVGIEPTESAADRASGEHHAP